MGQNFYKRDDRDVQFVLKEHLHIESLLKYEAFKDFSLEDFDMILDQAQKIAANDIAPSFQDGDREGCRFDHGKVSVPESFRHAWRVFQEGSWFALAMKPDILLMDEPTSALDPISTAKIEELIEELKDNYTIIIVTHNMQQAARVSDETAFFYLGNLIEYNKTEKIFTKPEVKQTEDYITGRFG